ncbi:MAG: histidinol-phosphatase HisJ [Candidatus Thorarchaeota archaeon]
MIFQDWHTHNLLCSHAIGSIEDYVTKAIEKGLDLIGISDHFTYECLKGIESIPYEEYAMKIEDLDPYISSVLNLKKKYHAKIDIKLAFELDFIENQVTVQKPYLEKFSKHLDYILGSVHILLRKGNLFAFDDSRFLKDYLLYENINEIYIEYYDTIQNMINSPYFSFDIVSHFDLPKKFNKRPEDPKLVADYEDMTLELIKKKDLAVEINTSGLRKKVGEQYPSNEIIKKLYDLDIPILLGSDAHHPDEVGYNFNEMIKLVKRIGFSQLAYFEKRKRSFIDIK